MRKMNEIPEEGNATYPLTIGPRTALALAYVSQAFMASSKDGAWHTFRARINGFILS